MKVTADICFLMEVAAGSNLRRNLCRGEPRVDRSEPMNLAPVAECTGYGPELPPRETAAASTGQRPVLRTVTLRM